VYYSPYLPLFFVYTLALFVVLSPALPPVLASPRTFHKRPRGAGSGWTCGTGRPRCTRGATPEGWVCGTDFSALAGRGEGGLPPQGAGCAPGPRGRWTPCGGGSWCAGGGPTCRGKLGRGRAPRRAGRGAAPPWGWCTRGTPCLSPGAASPPDADWCLQVQPPPPALPGPGGPAPAGTGAGQPSEAGSVRVRVEEE